MAAIFFLGSVSLPKHLSIRPQFIQKGDGCKWGKFCISSQKRLYFPLPGISSVQKQRKNVEFVKSQKRLLIVIPAKAGIQFFQILIDSLNSGFHRSDDFLRDHQKSQRKNQMVGGKLLQIFQSCLLLHTVE
jgi:hypothetical protein